MYQLSLAEMLHNHRKVSSIVYHYGEQFNQLNPFVFDQDFWQECQIYLGENSRVLSIEEVNVKPELLYKAYSQRQMQIFLSEEYSRPCQAVIERKEDKGKLPWYITPAKPYFSDAVYQKLLRAIAYYPLGQDIPILPDIFQFTPQEMALLRKDQDSDKEGMDGLISRLHQQLLKIPVQTFLMDNFGNLWANEEKEELLRTSMMTAIKDGFLDFSRIQPNVEVYHWEVNHEDATTENYLTIFKGLMLLRKEESLEENISTVCKEDYEDLSLRENDNDKRVPHKIAHVIKQAMGLQLFGMKIKSLIGAWQKTFASELSSRIDSMEMIESIRLQELIDLSKLEDNLLDYAEKIRDKNSYFLGHYTIFSSNFSVILIVRDYEIAYLAVIFFNWEREYVENFQTCLPEHLHQKATYYDAANESNLALIADDCAQEILRFDLTPSSQEYCSARSAI